MGGGGGNGELLRKKEKKLKICQNLALTGLLFHEIRRVLKYVHVTVPWNQTCFERRSCYCSMKSDVFWNMFMLLFHEIRRVLKDVHDTVPWNQTCIERRSCYSCKVRSDMFVFRWMVVVGEVLIGPTCELNLLTLGYEFHCHINVRRVNRYRKLESKFNETKYSKLRKTIILTDI